MKSIRRERTAALSGQPVKSKVAMDVDLLTRAGGTDERPA